MKDYPPQERTDIRLSLPSKGRMADDTLQLLADAGLRVHKTNPRQLTATVPSMPGLTILFQRAGDIITSVIDGSIDFGVTGWDLLQERGEATSRIVVMRNDLGYGQCTLNVIVPGSWTHVTTMADLALFEQELGRPLRVTTKFPHLTRTFFKRHGLTTMQLVEAEGSLEVAPWIGYADLIVDLVSSGTTLRDNQLRMLTDGQILESQACLIANRQELQSRPEVLTMARQLIEFIEAHLRAKTNVAIFANMRGQSAEDVAAQIFSKRVIGGLQGPTISPILTRTGETWYAVNIIVQRSLLPQAIGELREIGGSGVIVMPVTYIFEEEPPAWRDVLAALEQ